MSSVHEFLGWVAIGLNVALFVQWQKRGQEKPEEAEQPKRSRFGRPLRRRATPVPATATANGGDA